MKRTINHIIVTLFATVFLVGCNDNQTLQKYFVDNQEDVNFISVDLPISILNLDESKLTNDQLEAYESVKSLNFLGYKKNETDVATFNSELTKVKSILNNEKYNDLIEFRDKGTNILIKYLGKDDQADEFIVFGSSNEMGFGIVRVLGNNMKPDKMVTLVNEMKNSNVDESQLKSIMGFFK